MQIILDLVALQATFFIIVFFPPHILLSAKVHGFFFILLVPHTIGVLC